MRLEIETWEKGDSTEVKMKICEGPVNLIGYGTASAALGLVVVRNMIKLHGWSKAEAIEKVKNAFEASILDMLEGEAAEQTAQESE